MLKLSNTHKSFSRSPAEASEDNFTVLRNFLKNKVRRKSLVLGWGKGNSDVPDLSMKYPTRAMQLDLENTNFSYSKGHQNKLS